MGRRKKKPHIYNKLPSRNSQLVESLSILIGLTNCYKTRFVRNRQGRPDYAFQRKMRAVAPAGKRVRLAGSWAKPSVWAREAKSPEVFVWRG